MRSWEGVAPAVLLGLALGSLGSVSAPPASALVTIRLEASTPNVTVGGTLDVDVIADLSQPIAGWGFDLVFDDALLSAVGPPAIGLDWTPVPAGDGDGLAARAFPTGILGDEVLLAVLTLQADAPGTSSISVETTAGDLTEGFVLDPIAGSGFDTLAPIAPLMIQIAPIPEPATGLLVGVGVVALACAARRRVRCARQAVSR